MPDANDIMLDLFKKRLLNFIKQWEEVTPEQLSTILNSENTKDKNELIATTKDLLKFLLENAQKFNPPISKENNPIILALETRLNTIGAGKKSSIPRELSELAIKSTAELALNKDKAENFAKDVNSLVNKLNIFANNTIQQRFYKQHIEILYANYLQFKEIDTKVTYNHAIEAFAAYYKEISDRACLVDTPKYERFLKLYKDALDVEAKHSASIKAPLREKAIETQKIEQATREKCKQITKTETTRLKQILDGAFTTLENLEKNIELTHSLQEGKILHTELKKQIDRLTHILDQYSALFDKNTLLQLKQQLEMRFLNTTPPEKEQHSLISILNALFLRDPPILKESELNKLHVEIDSLNDLEKELSALNEKFIPINLLMQFNQNASNKLARDIPLIIGTIENAYYLSKDNQKAMCANLHKLLKEFEDLMKHYAASDLKTLPHKLAELEIKYNDLQQEIARTKNTLTSAEKKNEDEIGDASIIWKPYIDAAYKTLKLLENKDSLDVKFAKIRGLLLKSKKANKLNADEHITLIKEEITKISQEIIKATEHYNKSLKNYPEQVASMADEYNKYISKFPFLQQLSFLRKDINALASHKPQEFRSSNDPLTEKDILFAHTCLQHQIEATKKLTSVRNNLQNLSSCVGQLTVTRYRANDDLQIAKQLIKQLMGELRPEDPLNALLYEFADFIEHPKIPNTQFDVTTHYTQPIKKKTERLFAEITKRAIVETENKLTEINDLIASFQDESTKQFVKNEINNTKDQLLVLTEQFAKIKKDTSVTNYGEIIKFNTNLAKLTTGRDLRYMQDLAEDMIIQTSDQICIFCKNILLGDTKYSSKDKAAVQDFQETVQFIAKSYVDKKTKSQETKDATSNSIIDLTKAELTKAIKTLKSKVSLSLWVRFRDFIVETLPQIARKSWITEYKMSFFGHYSEKLKQQDEDRKDLSNKGHG
ncbi:MAG: hypothetical protein A3F18_08640 [Legionellales bacterium RIFCSPHIGHO2_12_FULL_37_14]|nr:MAG: hypothetical protein A3F18_08640 [Legionellales bacterium RIFCSPHIGHO2_12_FULL_37_14]